jgi:hypothetical protein
MLVSGWLIKVHVVPIESTPVSLDPDPQEASTHASDGHGIAVMR